MRYLTEAYHYVKHSTRLLAAAAGRLPPANRALFDRFITHSREESGHDDWLLRDLRALGANVESVIGSSPLPETEALFALQYYWIEHETPLALLGYIYALETLGSGSAAQLGGTLKRALKIEDDCISFLTGHGVDDVDHVEKLRRLLNQHITLKQDEVLIIRSAIATLKFYGYLMDACANP
jgi:pyrroloquinoline quinone (PQQ) biosynthesis protein C